jgi:hypothetical protein
MKYRQDDRFILFVLLLLFFFWGLSKYLETTQDLGKALNNLYDNANHQ